MLHPDVLEFIRGSIKSVWGLEILLLLKAKADQAWSADEIVRELRASTTLVTENLSVLETCGLLARTEDGRWSFAPAAPVLNELTERLEAAYRERPVGVIKAIASAPNDKLQTFADAFRLTPDRPKGDPR